jgi:hypothetical protein
MPIVVMPDNDRGSELYSHEDTEKTVSGARKKTMGVVTQRTVEEQFEGANITNFRGISDGAS